ncbi:MAG: sigma 54-interacting transcriptional regulator, partial [Blastocatellia bacterium]
MTPRLIVVAGPSEGASFAVTEAEVLLGRELDSQICIPDMSVSRHHCSLRREGEQFFLHDNGSLNATYVNGIPVSKHSLSNGDRIRMGDTILLFLCESEAADERVSGVMVNSGEYILKNTVLLRRDEGPIAPVRESPSQSLTTSRSSRDLNAMLKLSLAINSFRDSDALLRHLLELIGTVIPADRGAILQTEEQSREIASICGWQRRADAMDPIQVSRTVIEQVLRDGVAILCDDVRQNLAFRGVVSLAYPNTSALLAAPVIIAEKVAGLIYLDSITTEKAFDQDHLELLRAIANLTAVALENLRRIKRLESENQRLRAEIAIEHDMVGDGPRMQQVYQVIARAAPTDATVLIRGESGTGKELAARAIHTNSTRSGKPFVAINCAALTETLLESELFGYEKGAFTGATAQKKGKLESAQGGTVFLDEIGEMTPQLQAKLLRVMQEREFERVGGTRTIKADIRFIAATNRNLEQAIKEGRFREDLFYRLNVIGLQLPPLRERAEDISRLANYFISKYGQRCGRKIGGIAPAAMNCLMKYAWPGNVREFENTIERAIVLGSGDTIELGDLPESVIEAIEAPAGAGAPAGDAPGNFYEAVNEAKKRLILDAFQQANGSYTDAARLLDMHPNHLHRLIRNLDMKAQLKIQKLVR